MLKLGKKDRPSLISEIYIFNSRFEQQSNLNLPQQIFPSKFKFSSLPYKQNSQKVLYIIYSFYYQTPMSNSKSRSPYFYSPLKVQADQKEVIISHLREEVYLLQKNEQQFYILEEQYRNLDHKYRLLSEEKAIADADFKERHELALRNICDLKNEIDSLRADIRDRSLQIGDLQTDENTLRNQLDQKMVDIERLKNDLTSLLADNQQLLNQKIRLEEIASGIRRDNQALISNLKNTQIDNESIRRKIQDLQKYSSQLKQQDSLLRQKIISYENQNNQLDADINATIQDLTQLDTEINAAQNDIANLQNDIASVTAVAEKYKSEAIHYQRATQNQIMKNNDLSKNISQAENVLRVRINQVQEGRREVATLRGENQGLNKVNNRLDDDLQYCRKHLENLAFLNNDLVLNLQKYSEEDQIVRNLIDRRNRVIRAQARVQQVGQMNYKRGGATLISTGYASGYSPSRKSKVIY